MQRDRDYIGDGVYVWNDGYQIWLETERPGGTESIALEPQVFDALIAYRERLKLK